MMDGVVTAVVGGVRETPAYKELLDISKQLYKQYFDVITNLFKTDLVMISNGEYCIIACSCHEGGMPIMRLRLPILSPICPHRIEA